MLKQCTNDYYLESMGIVRWTLRKQEFVCSSIQTQQGVLTLVATITGQTSMQQQQLWENILNALCYVKIKDSAVPMEPILAFGKSALKKLTAKNCIITYSLAELIEQPQYKAKVWDVIKNKIVATS
jgi:DNA polymerase III psi subunit